MGWLRTGSVICLAAVGAGAAFAQPKPAPKPAVKQVVNGPVATYWMSAQTSSGFGAGMMGGKKPSMGAMMSMMTSGGGGAQHSLILQLGSSRKPTGAPQAEHLPPQGLGVGPSLPLLTPTAEPTQRTEEAPSMPKEYQRPKGRMLIFWGCGDHARPGQPVVIDFAQMAAGKVPPGLAALGQNLAITPMQPPSPGRNATYGEWPNAKTRTPVPGQGSLVGSHTIKGNYSPDIAFALSPSQDFLAPLQLTTNAVGPMGSALLAWNAVPGAQAYLASAIGGGEAGGGQVDMVLWTSSEVQASAFGLTDFLSNADLNRLVTSKALLSPATTRCAVPKEVMAAAPHALVQLSAYGGETNLSYPARPADPRTPWNIDWSVKVRYKSQTGAIVGMEMPGMDAGRSGQPQRPGQPPPPRPSIGGSILRGVLAGKIPGT